MAQKKYVHGVDKAIDRINRHFGAMPTKAMPALLKSVSAIRKTSLTQFPRVPVKTGNLRNSWTVRPFFNEQGNPLVLFGFTAEYALYVHEKVGANFKEGQGAKFFESAIIANHDRILRYIRNAL